MKFRKMISTFALAAVFGIGMAQSASAGIVSIIQSAAGMTGPNPPTNLVLTYYNRDMGTVYNFNGGPVGTTFTDTGNSANANDINNTNNILAQATDSMGDEDTWGVAYVSTIDAGDNGSPDYLFGQGGEYMTIMFYGGHDTSTSLLANGVQDTESANVHMDVYVTTTNPLVGGVLAPNGSSDRTGVDSYNNITTGTKVLSLISDSFETLYNGSANGSGDGYFSVVSGSLAGAFDTDQYTNANGGTSDLHVQFTTAPFHGSGANDWLVSSNDPARAAIVPLPGAAAMGYGMMGLLAVARKRRRSA